MNDLHDEFRRQAPDAPTTAGWADRARAKARRRRIVAGAGATALFVALAVPAGMWLVSDLGDDAVPAPAESVSSTPPSEVSPETYTEWPEATNAEMCAPYLDHLGVQDEAPAGEELPGDPARVWLCEADMGEGIQALSLPEEALESPDLVATAIESFNEIPLADPQRECTAELGPGFTVVFEYADGTEVPVRGGLYGCRELALGAGPDAIDRLGAEDYLEHLTDLFAEQAATPPPSAPDGALAGRVMLMDDPEQEGVQMCVIVGESYPPYCVGPRVEGEIDWESLDATEHGEHTFAGSVWLVGEFDDTYQTFQLAAPPTLERPEGAQEPTESEWVSPPDLCDDPRRGGAEGEYEPPVDEESVELHEAIRALPGYVDTYAYGDGTTDGYNVMVTHDAEGAHAKLRELYQGDLCVAEVDRPTFAARQAASEAIHDDSILGSHSAGGGLGGIDGKVDVSLWSAPDELVDRAEELAAPYLDPEWLEITAVFNPLGE